MSTTDKNLTESQSTGTSESQEEDEAMRITEEEEHKTLAKFGGGKDDDDWGEFAEEEEEEKPAAKEVTEKPKYTFGASSGFGTKGWAASHQTIPTPTKVRYNELYISRDIDKRSFMYCFQQPTFGGFGSNSGFGGFKTSTGLASNDNAETEKKPTTAVPSFGSFAKATTSPFAAAAAASANALSSSQTQITSPTASATSTDADNTKDSEANDSDEDESAADVPLAFGEGARVKVPGVKKQTQGIYH